MGITSANYDDRAHISLSHAADNTAPRGTAALFYRASAERDPLPPGGEGGRCEHEGLQIQNPIGGRSQK